MPNISQESNFHVNPQYSNPIIAKPNQIKPNDNVRNIGVTQF